MLEEAEPACLGKIPQSPSLECKILRKLKLASTVLQHGIFPGPDVLHCQNTSDPLHPLRYLADAGLNDALFTVP